MQQRKYRFIEGNGTKPGDTGALLLKDLDPQWLLVNEMSH